MVDQSAMIVAVSNAVSICEFQILETYLKTAGFMGVQIHAYEECFIISAKLKYRRHSFTMKFGSRMQHTLFDG